MCVSLGKLSSNQRKVKRGTGKLGCKSFNSVADIERTSGGVYDGTNDRGNQVKGRPGSRQHHGQTGVLNGRSSLKGIFPGQSVPGRHRQGIIPPDQGQQERNQVSGGVWLMRY